MALTNSTYDTINMVESNEFSLDAGIIIVYARTMRDIRESAARIYPNHFQ